jgi:hypothetical protein
MEGLLHMRMPDKPDAGHLASHPAARRAKPIACERLEASAINPN